MEASKETSCPRGGSSGEACARHTDRGVVRVGQKNELSTSS
jgi:hypothetical protein